MCSCAGAALEIRPLYLEASAAQGESMRAPSSYEKRPYVQVSSVDRDCDLGWAQILEVIRARQLKTIAIECYPGVLQQPFVTNRISALSPSSVIHSESAFLPAVELQQKFAAALTDDPVFGRMCPWELEDFFDPQRLREACAQGCSCKTGLVVAVGTGASLVLPHADFLIYVDVARWEIQQRQRRKEIANLGLNNFADSPAQLYKRAFFVDWRAADRLRHRLYERVDYWIDGNVPEAPRGLAGPVLRSALSSVSHRPFRVVPYFDPGPWGGHWMRSGVRSAGGRANYAWCFDCVPEENSLLLGYGEDANEVPCDRSGDSRIRGSCSATRCYARFGTEFPIRFDFLDTMGGGNLSLQVHPLTEYIQDKFGMHYTQDESYYLLDAEPGAVVYLGLRTASIGGDGARSARGAERSQLSFPAETYVNQFPGAASRPLPDSGRDHSLLGQGQYGAGDQRDTVHLHLQAVGLGTHGARWTAATNSHRARSREHSMGPHN